MFCCAFPYARARSEVEFEGQTVGKVLHSLQPQGLSFIYNSQLVPDSLRVLREPRARDGLALASEVLDQHGLALSEVAPRIYTIIAQPRGKTTATTADAAPPRASVATPVEEVVVQASRYTLAAAGLNASHTFLTHDQLNALPRLGDESLRAVQHLPGASSNGFSSVAAMRGGDPGETAILLDGLRLYEPFHLKNFLSPVSLLDSRALAQVDVYSGGFPVQYGERMSAIIDAHTVRPQDSRYVELGLSLFHASGLASAAFDDERGHVLISGRRSNLGELASLAEEDFGRPRYADALLRVDYQLSSATMLSWHTLASDDRITAKTSSNHERARAEYNNYYTWAALTHQWARWGTTQVIGSYTHVHNERSGSIEDFGRRTALIDDARKFDVAGLRIDHRFAPLTAFEHRFGVEVRRLKGQYDYRSNVQFAADYPFPGYPANQISRLSKLDPDGYESMGYWDTRWHFAPRWTLEAGLRVETQTYDHSGDPEQWSPRLNVLYELSPRTRWRASWGRFYQAQTINELQVEDGVDHFYPAQSATHSILSFEHSFNERFDVRIEAYQKDYDNPNPRFENALDPLELLPEAEFDRVRVDPDSARVRGLEVLLNLREMNGWSAWFGYAWTRAEDRIDGKDVPRSWDQRQAFTAGLRWSRGPWDFSLTDTYHSGWPTTAVQFENGIAVLGLRNAERLGAYNAVDFRLTRTLPLPRGVLDVFIEASNALSRANPCCSEYSVENDSDGTPQLDHDTDDWLPLVPSFGVLWRY